MDLFWSLPGPRRFLHRIQSDLRDGSNVVLRLPAIPPPVLKTALQRMLREEWDWLSLEGAGSVPPAETLCRMFLPDLPPEEICNAQTLANAADFSGYLIWLEGLAPGQWPYWRVFLEEYGHACRSRPRPGHSLFLVPLQGDLVLDPPREDIALRHHAWRGVVEELDMLLFAGLLLQEKAVPTFQRPLLAAVLARLALWDPEVVVRLGACSASEMLTPVPFLRGMAAERGWTGAPPSWEQGSLNEVGGRECVHSAHLALDDPGRLGTRIWSAQVSVILPLVEEQRQALVPRVAHLLRLPFDTGYGRIEDPREMEIGHIAYQLRGAPIPQRLYRRVQKLWLVRNALAHVEPLAPEEALSRELYEPV